MKSLFSPVILVITILFCTLGTFSAWSDGSNGRFSVGISPGEGLPNLIAKKGKLQLFSKPSLTANKVYEKTIKIGSQIKFVESQNVAVRATEVKILADTHLMGRNFGKLNYLSKAAYYNSKAPHKKIILKKGDSIQYLQDCAEGSCFARINGNIFDIDECYWTGGFSNQKAKYFREISGPKTEWWVKIPYGSNSSGWTLVSPESMTFGDRSF